MDIADPTRCLGPGCRRTAKARGLCDTHLQQLYRTGRLWEIGKPPARLVECRDCGNTREHYALGRCNPCYQKFRRLRHAQLARPAVARG